MFNSTELYLLHKLLHRIKYTEFDSYEMNEFSNSPITNEILEKLQTYFAEKLAGTQHSKNVNKSRFEFDSQIGIAIRNRIKHLDENVIKTISKWEDEQIEKFAIHIIGPIDWDQSELDKLKSYISNLRRITTSR